MPKATPLIIPIGTMGKTHGIKGFLKIHSQANPKEQIFDYLPWSIEVRNTWQPVEIDRHEIHGDTLLVHIKNVDSPEEAQKYVGKTIGIPREKLPSLSNDEYYWTDLEGMQVVTEKGDNLGHVDHLFETPAYDILVVVDEHKKRTLIPFLRNKTIHRVDLAARTIYVNLDEMA